MILMLDNYDSFTHNVVQELGMLTDEPVEVVRNDRQTVEALLDSGPRAIVVSPGPGTPERAGVTMALIAAAEAVPLLGICLGHQALAAVHGGRVVRGGEPVHGKTSPIHHDGRGVFEGIPNPFEATRYHSLVVDPENVPDVLEVTAWTGDGVIMGLRHRERPHHSVQFHPESYLTRSGLAILANFLRLAGIPVRDIEEVAP